MLKKKTMRNDAWVKSWLDEGYLIKQLIDGTNVFMFGQDWDYEGYKDRCTVFYIDKPGVTAGSCGSATASIIVGYTEHHNMLKREYNIKNNAKLEFSAWLNLFK